MADSLATLPDCRQEARMWHKTADSLQVAATKFEQASARNLDAKRAAENSEAFQRRLTDSKAAEATEYKAKAHRRGFVVYLLLAVDVAVGVFLVTH